jgi:uncharacterized phage protein (TIGR01671 family)
MRPKFRAWIKTENCFADYIESIRFYINEIDLCWGGICESDCFDFKDVILMQSTGLKDKNGQEIFEGDIITNGIDIVDVRNHETLGFYTMVNGREVFFGHGTSIEEFEEDIEGFTEIAEIIGNIYENPELLEVEG